MLSNVSPTCFPTCPESQDSNTSHFMSSYIISYHFMLDPVLMYSNVFECGCICWSISCWYIDKLQILPLYYSRDACYINLHFRSLGLVRKIGYAIHICLKYRLPYSLRLPTQQRLTLAGYDSRKPLFSYPKHIFFSAFLLASSLQSTPNSYIQWTQLGHSPLNSQWRLTTDIFCFRD